MANIQSTFAFIFDSGKLGSSFYGEVVFEHMIKGGELSNNHEIITVSLGDIFINQRYIDIEPYVIKDEFCTLDFDDLLGQNRFVDFPFCWIVENLSSEIACAIDKRLKENLKGYVGLSRVDKSNTLKRKQFWKHTIKKFSLSGNTIISFQDPQLEGVFAHSEKASELGYAIKYNPCFDDELDNSEETTNVHNKEKEPSVDIDRDLLMLNFSIRQELQISGALLWKSINALSKIYFNVDGTANDHLVEYPFFTLYFASQGIERIQKAIVELVCKKNHISEKEKDGVYDLLFELKSSNSSDLNNDIKNNFGNCLGKLASMYFDVYNKLCSDLNIYAYELEYDSAACIVYWHSQKNNNLYKEFLRRQNAKKEILYWLMKEASKYPKYSFATEDTLNFDANSVERYLWELIFNSEDGQDCYDEVDCLYDELCSIDKDKWKNRLELMNYLISER